MRAVSGCAKGREAATGLLDGSELVASYYTLSGSPVFEPSRYPFADRVAAARRAGFAGLGTTVEDFDAIVASGVSPAAMRELLEAHGVGVPELEGIGPWDRDGADGERSRRMEERLYELADLFGSRRLNVGVIDGDGTGTRDDAFVERFAALCDRALEHGLVVGLEPLVLGWLRNPAQAAEVVAAAARPNAGVLLDSYHVFRGSQTIAEALGEVRPEQIVAVQINDALIEPQGSVFDDCCTHRLVPGEGEQPLVEFLVALARAGVDAPLAIELMADDLRPLPVDAAAQRVASATAAVLAQSRDALAGA